MALAVRSAHAQVGVALIVGVEARITTRRIILQISKNKVLLWQNLLKIAFKLTKLDQIQTSYYNKNCEFFTLQLAV